MLNQIVIVGRLVKDPELVKDGEKNSTTITLAVPRSYKNVDGEYETDFVDCILWKSIAKNAVEYCKKGDILGVKGRIQTRSVENEDGTKNKITEIIAEKVTFLSSHKEEEPKDESNTIVCEED